MQLFTLSRFAPATIMFVLMCSAFDNHAYAVDTQKSEEGRVQICSSHFKPGDQGSIEFPSTGQFIIPAAKAGSATDLIVVQTEFPSAPGVAGASQPDLSGWPAASMQTRDGKSWITLGLKGQNCLYLHASAPVLDRPGFTLSGTTLVPDWNDGASGQTYRYLNQFDTTLYVAVELGKELNFVTHEFSTGSNLSHDQNLRVANTNDNAQRVVPDALRAALPTAGQFDIDMIDTDQYDINLKDFDTDSAAEVKKLVAKFSAAIHPVAHAKLLLVLPKHGKVQLKFVNTTVVGSKFEGLGFYRDATLHIIFDSKRSDFVPIAAFANFELVLIDIDNATILASKSEAYGHNFFRPPFQTDDPLNSLDAFASIPTLGGVMKHALVDAMPEIFTSH